VLRLRRGSDKTKTMSSSDETYLESFLEALSTSNNSALSYEIKRNLELMRQLDNSNATIFDKLSRAEDSYIEKAEQIISNLHLPATTTNSVTADGTVEISPIIQQTENDNNRKQQDDVRNESNDVEMKDACGDGRVENELCDDKRVGPLVTTDRKDNSSRPAQCSRGVVVIPTTEELEAFIEDPAQISQIEEYRNLAKHNGDEKVAIAEQTYAIVDSLVRRLDYDLVKLETLLKGTGEFESTSSNTLIGGIAPSSGNGGASLLVGSSGSGNLSTSSSGRGKPNDLAAIQIDPGLSSENWILGKIMEHNSETGMYKISDEDVESSKTFTLPESQVVVLGGVERLRTGEIIFAVYPDTTTLYQATVVQPPRRMQNAGTYQSFVMVHFKDDSDEHGVTLPKAVLMKHVMRPPALSTGRVQAL